MYIEKKEMHVGFNSLSIFLSKNLQNSFLRKNDDISSVEFFFLIFLYIYYVLKNQRIANQTTNQ